MSALRVRMSGKGETYLAEANKALNRTLIFGFGRAQKYEDAAEAFKKAGNAFKLGNLWQSAGDAFLQEADAWMQAGDNKTDAINAIVEAANCYKKINPVDAINAFKRAIDHYNENGRFGMSARYYKEIAEIFEADHNFPSAAEAYESAAQMFIRDNKQSNANTCMLKVATYVSEGGELLKAAKIYEDIAKESLGKQLTSFAAKGYFLSALLCFLALGDAVQVRNKLEEYKNADFSFTASRECDFITKLIEAVEAYDGDSYSQHCADFDRITPLDPWKTTMLLKGKKFITDMSGDEPDLS